MTRTFCASYAIFQVVRPVLAPYRLVRRGWRHCRRLFRSFDAQIDPWNTSSSLLSGKSAVNRSRYPVCIILDAICGVTWLVDWQAHVLVVRFVFILAS